MLCITIHKIVYNSPKPDYFSQIKNIPNSYLVIDDIELGGETKIPLWLLGFLY